MNRELKFRAWHPMLKCFIYFSNLEMIHQNKYELSARESIEMTGGSHVYHYWNEVAPIQQYTGLKDSKGKEIYEGDIIKWSKTFRKKKYENQQSCTDFSNPIFSDPETEFYLGEVVFDKFTDGDDFYVSPMLAWGLKTKSSITSLCGIMEQYSDITSDTAFWETTYNKYEVVGNIFENEYNLK